MLVLLLATAAATAACGDSDLACTNMARSAVDMVVRDAQTDAPIEGALIVVREGTFADSARTTADGTPDEPFLAPNRAGVYDVSVQASGFETWVRTDVVVDLNECDQADTRFFEVDLVPEQAAFEAPRGRGNRASG